MKDQNKRSKSCNNKQVEVVVNGSLPAGDSDVGGVESSILNALTDAFSNVSVEEAKCAYNEANGDLNKAMEILGDIEERKEEDKITSCSSSSGNVGSSNSDVSFGGHSVVQRKAKAKKLVAATGSVSMMIGKDYVRTTPKKSGSKFKGGENLSNDEVEQFLCSMLGEDSDLSLAVVQDVLCQCGYEVDKALSVLLELSASSNEQPKLSDCSANWKEEAVFLHSSDGLTDRTSDSTSHSSEGEVQDNVWFWGPPGRNLYAGNSAHSSSSTAGNSVAELPQEILESLFNMPTHKSAEHEPTTMNWKNVVKKMTSLGQRFGSCPNDIPPPQHTHAEGAEYQLYRETAKQHWESMRSHFQKATTAFSNGQKEHAAYLADQGRLHNRKAQEADEKASRDIFAARNKNIENMITIDLHGQHVKPAMRLLKLHLLFGAFVRSVRLFRVITGCGAHGLGKSKLKNSVIELLKKERIEWTEENRGMLLIKLDGRMNFSFLDVDDDDDN
ncbi:SMR domain-containing protein At5g58720 [Lycium barbarum]|uniref:SMR domain-containing protein At5g58720 n=1 Tax=Lycium barbarum TaxID=112863 RepID=UPI00293E7EE5|nr:SMR domain-containing protein At5g58720 [Lycium barbarum]